MYIDMLSTLLGNQTTERIMRHLYHYGETYPSAIAQDYGIAITPILHQLKKFESEGILITKKGHVKQKVYFTVRHQNQPGRHYLTIISSPSKKDLAT